jgi:dihydrodipicolinate synthase/N-acetylneuraminate lyase
MKEQETMRNQMINAYKMGNIAEADKIKKALTPAVDG